MVIFEKDSKKIICYTDRTLLSDGTFDIPIDENLLFNADKTYNIKKQIVKYNKDLGENGGYEIVVEEYKNK